MTRTMGILVLAAILSISGWKLVTELYSDEPSSEPTKLQFESWPQPDVVLFLTGRQYGYIEPCGCSGLATQKGGLARRHTLLEQLRARGWKVVPLDVGNQVRRIGVQAAAKFQSTIDALREMGYRAVGLGPDDLRLSFGELLAAVVASTDDQGMSDLFLCANANPVGFVNGHRLIEEGGMKIGVVSVLGKEFLDRVTHDEIEKSDPLQAAQASIKALKAQGCDFYLLLAHASIEESAALAKQLPEVDLVYTAGGSGEPTYLPEKIEGSKAIMIQSGTKSMHVGIVGLYKQGRPGLRYERVALDARFKDSPAMLEVLSAYQAKLREQGLSGLGLRPVRHPDGQFVGSEACGDCHSQAYEKWLETPHHHATESIVHPPERSLVERHFDPECLSCHVTGWNPQGYFPYETGYLNLADSEAMHGSGCENCHGPGKAHVEAESGESDATDEQIEQLRQQMVLKMGPATHEKCLECHDLDNSPDFHVDGAFEKYWEKVAHPWKD